MPRATAQCIGCQLCSARLIPNSTLSVRHEPIATGPAAVRLSAPSYNNTARANSAAVSVGLVAADPTRQSGDRHADH